MKKSTNKNTKLRDPDGIIYKYPDRDCKSCLNYPCFYGIENLKSNFAKYGCQQYDEKSSESEVNNSSE